MATRFSTNLRNFFTGISNPGAAIGSAGLSAITSDLSARSALNQTPTSSSKADEGFKLAQVRAKQGLPLSQTAPNTGAPVVQNVANQTSINQAASPITGGVRTAPGVDPNQNIQQQINNIQRQAQDIQNQIPTASTQLTDRDVNISLDNPSPSVTDQFLGSEERTGFDINNLLEENRKFRQDFLDTQLPTENERELQNQLADIRTRAEDFQLSLEQGKEAQFGLGRPLALSTGRAQRLETLSTFERRALASEESNLLAKLGFEQEAREARGQVLKSVLTFIGQDIDLQFKIQDKIDERENQLFQRASTLTSQAQSRLTFIADKFEGLSFNDLDGNDQEALLDVAQAAGIPFGVLVEGMEVVKVQREFDNLIETQKIAIAAQKAGLGAGTTQGVEVGRVGGGFGGINFVENPNLTAEQKKKRDNILQGAKLIDQVEELYKEAVGVELDVPVLGGLAARAKGFTRFAGKVFGIQPKFSAYTRFLDSNKAAIAKGLKGEVGNLAANEQRDALKSFPGGFTSPAEAEIGFQEIRNQIRDQLSVLGTVSEGLVNVQGQNLPVGSIVKNEQGQPGRVESDGTITPI